MTRLWTDPEIEILRDRYPNERTADLARALGRTVAQTYSKAAYLGLKKTLSYLNGPDAGRLQRGDNAGINVESQDDYNLLRDASDLLRVLAHVVDGKSLEKALGAPGDWGYETQIGQAIDSATKPTNPPSALNEAMRQDASSRG